MMKTIKIFTLLMVVLAVGACKKSFLDSEDVTQATEQNFYKTPEDAFKALVGTYDGLQSVWSEGVSFPVASEVLSDNAFGGTGNSDGYGYQMLDEFDKTRSPSDMNLFDANWGAYYRALYRVNVLLSKLDQIDWAGDEELRARYEGEARFLRAYLYFDMVRLWENIPLLTAPSAENLPQATPDEVYAVIAEDLKFAASHIPAASYIPQSATSGRVTKWAAQSLLARVYLFYTGYYGKSELAGISKAEVLAGVEEVITASGHDLVGEFKNLWPAASMKEYAGEDNIETVFAVKYTYTSDYDGNTDGNHWLVMLGMREQWSFPYGNGWGAATVNPKLWNVYANNDTRKVASIISIADEEIDFTKKASQREYTGYYNKKYTPTVDEEGNSVAVSKGAVNFMIGQFQDYVSIRFADVLLMATELGSPNAQQYFDRVRKRAYQDNFTALAPSPANLLKERQLEFFFEGHRYWDLLRQGIDVAASTIAESTTVENSGTSTVKTISASKIKETRGIQQIPYSQITLSSGVLKQNAGW